MINKQRFHRQNPDIYPAPTLREQILALEKTSGCTALMEYGTKLSIKVPVDDIDFPREERIFYDLEHEEFPASGLVKWTLRNHNKRQTIRDTLQKPELLDIVVIVRNTSFRGLKLEDEIYWTDNDKDYGLLEAAIKDLEDAKSRFKKLIES